LPALEVDQKQIQVLRTLLMTEPLVFLWRKESKRLRKWHAYVLRRFRGACPIYLSGSVHRLMPNPACSSCQFHGSGRRGCFGDVRQRRQAGPLFR